MAATNPNLIYNLMAKLDILVCYTQLKQIDDNKHKLLFNTIINNDLQGHINLFNIQGSTSFLQ